MTTAPTLTIRDRIRAIQIQAMAGNITPTQVRENLIVLIGLFGAVLDEHRDADLDMHLLTAAYIEAGEAFNRAELRAAITPQGQRAREARDIERLTLELIRGCKKFLDSLDTEMKLAR